MEQRSLAFTLVELIIVVAIIGVLSGVVVISLGDETDQARDASTRLAVASLRAPALSESLKRGVTAKAVCKRLYGKIRGGRDHVDTWNFESPNTTTCTAHGQADVIGEVCCHSAASQWVVWGRLSTFSSSSSSGNTEDYFCIDDDGFQDVVDSGTIVLSGSDFKCE